MKVKHCLCKGCGKVHRIPAKIAASKTASPCCGGKLRVIGKSI